MERRNFMTALGAVGLTDWVENSAPTGSSKRTRFYLLENYYLNNGTQLGRINDFMSRGLLPAMDKIHSGPKICLQGLVAAHLPQFVFMAGFESVEELWGVQSKARQNQDFAKAMTAWESGDEPPYIHSSASILEATDYSPELPVEPVAKSPRIFELRVYHSPTERQNKALHERFAGPEIKIFHRVGVHPLFYTTTLWGANRPNLTYLIPFEDLAAREKAWKAFGADPEWIKVRQESIEKNGQISLNSQISLYTATAYSPVR